MKLDPKKKIALFVLGGVFCFLVLSITGSVYSVVQASAEKQEVFSFVAVKALKHLFPKTMASAAMVQADKFFGRGEYDKAEWLYEEAFAVNQTDPTLLNNLGFILSKKGDTKRAAALFEKAVKGSPNCVECMNNWGLLLVNEQKVVLATGLFQRAINTNESYSDPLVNMAVLSEERSDWAKALYWYREALSHIKQDELKAAVSSRISWIEEVTSNYQREVAGQRK